MKINTLIVDDEPLARDGVRLHLAEHDDINIISECGNADEAIAALQQNKVDLVFLDIKMPGKTGFEVVNQIGTDKMPLVIFMTAYDEFAIEAFKINALDYLLKPINPERFEESLDRARNELTKNQIALHSTRLSALLNDLQPGQTKAPDDNDNNGRIVVRSHGHVYFVRPQDILWVEAEGDYVTIHTQGRKHLIRDTMRKMENRLQEHGFQRIHRSVIIKVDIIVELTSLDSGDYEVVIEDGTKLKLSRSYRDSLFERLNP